MRNLVVTALVIIAAFIATAANAQNKTIVGSNTYITKDVKVESFKHLLVLGSPDVIYTQTNSGAPKIEIYGPDNIVPLIETTVKDNTLTVNFKKNTSIKNRGKLEVRVWAPAVESMKVQGSGDITFANGISTDRLQLKVQGSGDIDGKKIVCDELNLDVTGSGDIDLDNIKVGTLNAKVSGSGDIDLEGTSTNANYSVAGSGDISASKLKADHVQANVSGSGDITCHAVKTLKGKVSGSGDVGYKGKPEISFSKKGLYKL